MLKDRQILVSSLGLVLTALVLSGCGQRGSLYLPTEAAAKDRRTLPELVLPTPDSKAQDPAVKTPAAPTRGNEGVAQ